MKCALTVLVLVMCGPVLAAAQKTAYATYSRNGALISLTDIAPIRDCKVRSIDGKVKDVDEHGGIVSFQIKSGRDRMSFQFPLNRLASAESTAYRKQLLRKGVRLRASGYACRPGMFEAITIERSY